MHPSSSTRVEPSPSTPNPVRIIPSPAGLVQQKVFILDSDGALMSKQEYMQKVVEDVGEDDDFKSGSWVNATNYVNVNGDTVTGYLGDIKNFLSQVLFSEYAWRSHRAALILANVLVFTPKPSMHYLNITMRNVVKVFHKDTVPGWKWQWLMHYLNIIIKCRLPIMWAGVGEGQLIGHEVVQETTEKISQIKDRLKDARDRVVRFGKKGKLAPRFVGPFEIIKKVGLVAYRLDLPEELNGVHDTFYPVEILEREFKKLKRSRTAIVKVRWNLKRGPEFTWDHEDQMKLKYPHLFSNVSS
ncbi:putative reverse transcriptase domain-containing protein [Tanacetum coccineum]